MSHSHPHHPIASTDAKRTYVYAILLNATFVLIEVYIGFISNSVALIGDALHNISDIATLGLGLLAVSLSGSKATHSYTYGKRKTSILIGLINALLLAGAMLYIGWEAYNRIGNHTPIKGLWVVFTAVGGIGINGFSAYMFRGEHKSDLNKRAAYLHLAADALVSVGVAVSGIIIYLTGLFWVDTLTTFCIIIVVLYSTFGLLSDAIRLALDGVPKDIDAKGIHQFFTKLQGVTQVHDLHIWPLSTSETALTVHLVIPEGEIGPTFLADIKEELSHHYNISHTTIQIEKDQCQTDCEHGRN